MEIDMDDWQGNIFLIKDRTALLLKNEILTDVRFTFRQINAENEPIVLKAHKLILANASIVFQKMFYGDFKESTEKDVEIVGIDWKVFAIMLKYLCTDEVKLETWDIAADVYDVANKYLLVALANFCIEFITKQLQAKNALKIFQFACLYELVELKKAALKIIKDQTLLVFETPDFTEVDINTMLTILEQDRLQANEMDLYTALESLAAAKGVCKNNGNPTNADVASNSQVTGQISNEFLKFRQAIKKINFTEMTAEQFSQGPALSKLLLPEEVSSIFGCLNQRCNIKTRYPKDFEQKARQKCLPRVSFDIAVEGSNIGRIIVELRSDVVPKTTEKFLALWTDDGEKGFKGACIDRIIKNECCSVTIGNSCVMDSENFILKHTEPGIVALCASDNKSCVCSFYFTFFPRRNKNVVIGKVVEGMAIVNYLNTLATDSIIPKKKIVIKNCSELKYNFAETK